jgi:hypothetical protein
MSIDDATIKDLLGFTDDLGVLSFYVGITPAQAADPQPTAPIEVRNDIRALHGRLADADPALAKAVDARIAALDGLLDALLDPKAPGRGRALFVGVRDGEVRTVSTQLPFRERVVHHESPFVRPLVAAVDEGRAAGVLVVSRSGTRMLRWTIGEVEELGGADFELTDAQLADEKSGPSPNNPQHHGRGFVAKERFEDRIDVNLHRFLDDAVGSFLTLATEHGWDRIVVAGSPKLRDDVREMVADRLPSGEGAPTLLVAEQAWEDTPGHAIADQLWPLLRSVRQDRERTLVATATDRALSGGHGAIGLRHVCEALNAGRVAHLLYDDGMTVPGFRSDEGTLHPRVEGLVATSDVALHREPLFVEAMIEKALGMGAAVTPIDTELADGLREHEGVAALLRW